MSTRIAGLVLGVLALGATTLAAQAQAPSNRFLLATYYECNYDSEGVADMMMQRLSPIMQKHVDAGHITSYGMSAHVLGGAWRRIVSMWGTRDALLDLWTALDGEMRAADPVALAAFNNTCGTHQDYLWSEVAASPPPRTPIPANHFRHSTYFFCNQAQEQNVDSLVIKTVGPEIQKHVAMGHVYDWNWLEHENGGTVRRVLTFTGPSVKALFQMRQAIFEGIGEKATQDLFGGACGNHFEYVWTSVPLTP